MSRTRHATIAVLAVLTLAAGCGSDDDGQARTVETTEAPTSEDTAAETASTDVAVEEETEEEGPGDASPVNDVVVRLEDLPTGWSEAPPSAEDDDTSFCDGHDPMAEMTPVEEASSDFQMSDFGPFLSSDAMRFATADDAQAFIDTFADAVNACSEFTETDDSGTTITYTLAPLSFPDLGDGTFAARMSATTPFGPLSVDFAVTVAGPTVLAVVNGGFGAPDTALTESSMRLMLDRI